MWLLKLSGRYCKLNHKRPEYDYYTFNRTYNFPLDFEAEVYETLDEAIISARNTIKMIWNRASYVMGWRGYPEEKIEKLGSGVIIKYGWKKPKPFSAGYWEDLEGFFEYFVEISEVEVGSKKGMKNICFKPYSEIRCIRRQISEIENAAREERRKNGYSRKYQDLLHRASCLRSRL